MICLTFSGPLEFNLRPHFTFKSRFEKDQDAASVRATVTTL
jgi:hypothetical protein